ILQGKNTPARLGGGGRSVASRSAATGSGAEPPPPQPRRLQRFRPSALGGMKELRRVANSRSAVTQARNRSQMEEDLVCPVCRDCRVGTKGDGGWSRTSRASTSR